MHSLRVRRYGSPDIVKTRPRGEVQAFIDAALTTDSDECILWPFAKSDFGYGILSMNKRGHRAHALVCERTHGARPDGYEAAHSCGVRLCINPRHLRWASRSENQLERAAHGTSNRGERQWSSRLTEDDVITIKAALAERRVSQGDLSRTYGVGRKTISDIATGKTWAWLTPRSG